MKILEKERRKELEYERNKYEVSEAFDANLYSGSGVGVGAMGYG